MKPNTTSIIDSRYLTAQVLRSRGLFDTVQLMSRYFGRLSSVVVWDRQGNVLASHPPINNQGNAQVKLYLSGPMTGYTNDNKPAFNAKAHELAAMGYTVINPAILPSGLTQAEYMDISLAMLRAANVVYFLPNWKESEGAQSEYWTAKKSGLSMIFERPEDEPKQLTLSIEQSK